MPRNSTRRSMKGWTEIAKDLDIVQEARELGVEIVQGHPTSKNYVACWAYDRPHGDSPSAGINVNTGWYRDHGGSGEGLYLYELRHRMGLSATVEDALVYYAAKVGKTEEISFELQGRAYAESSVKLFGWGEDSQRMCIPFFRANPELTAEAAGLCGAEYAVWPKNSPDSNSVIAFRSYGRGNQSKGFVLQSRWPRGIQRYRGPDAPPEWQKRIVLGSSGMVGRHGLDVMQTEECELVIKVEGITDMLALQALIPEELRDRVAVVTNACGCRDIPADGLEFFRGKRVVVLHDSDVPGQEGARMWCNALLGLTPHVKNLVLYEEIAQDHGPDVRDWIREGGTWEQLHQLINACPVFTPGEDEITPEATARMSLGANATEEQIRNWILLRSIGIVVLGHLENSSKIACFNEEEGENFQIANIGRWTMEEAMTFIGERFTEIISTSTEHDPNKYPFPLLRRAIALAASKNVVKADDQMGAGVWRVSDRIILVNDGSVSVANGNMTTTRVPMMDGKIIEFSPDPWYVHEEISELYNFTTNRQWCQDVFDEAVAIFERWDNWKKDDSPLILAAMVIATWIQTTLDFRPGMVVTGPTNSGKTFLTQECIAKMFGRMALFVTNPTEAGIRQAIGNTSKVLMIDEFESSSHRQKILEVLRSSTRGTDIVKGTTDHRGTKFHFRHIPWLSSIETGLRSAADRNRYIILDLDHVPRGRASTLQLPPVEELETIGKKLMVIGMRFHGIIRTLHVDLKATVVEGVDRRIVEAYSLPAAVMGAVSGLTLEESQQLLRDMLGRRFEAEDFEDESDEAGLLEAIAMTQVRTPHGEFTVAELVGMLDFDLPDKSYQSRSITPQTCLNKIGIKRTRMDCRQGRVGFAEQDAVAIAANTFRGKLKGTRFEGMNIEEILLRISGARKNRLVFSKKQLSSIVIPINTLVSAMDDQGEGESQADGEVF